MQNKNQTSKQEADARGKGFERLVNGVESEKRSVSE